MLMILDFAHLMWLPKGQRKEKVSPDSTRNMTPFTPGIVKVPQPMAEVVETITIPEVEADVMWVMWHYLTREKGFLILRIT
jgi:hypothetical protein